MQYETIKMQTALARWNHGQECAFFHTADGGPHELEDCRLKSHWMEKAGWALAAILPAMTQEITGPARRAAKAAHQEYIAQLIEAELVCCDLYEALNAMRPEQVGLSWMEMSSMSARDLAAKINRNYHSICHWGGFAAAIARDPHSFDRRDGDGQQAEAPEAP